MTRFKRLESTHSLIGDKRKYKHEPTDWKKKANDKNKKTQLVWTFNQKWKQNEAKMKQNQKRATQCFKKQQNKTLIKDNSQEENNNMINGPISLYQPNWSEKKHQKGEKIQLEKKTTKKTWRSLRKKGR